jgi:hypothetical protein
MKTVEVRFDVRNEGLMSDTTRQALLGYYQPVGIGKVISLWAPNSVPARQRLSIEVSGTCACFMDDWECKIFGSSYGQCLGTLCVLHNILVNELHKHLTFKILFPESEEGKLDKLIAGERRLRWLKRLGWLAIGAVVALGVERLVLLISQLR